MEKPAAPIHTNAAGELREEYENRSEPEDDDGDDVLSCPACQATQETGPPPPTPPQLPLHGYRDHSFLRMILNINLHDVCEKC